MFTFFFFQAEDGIRDESVTGVQTCALPIRLNSSHTLISYAVFWSSDRSEEHTSELQSHSHLVCRLLLEKKKHTYTTNIQRVSEITRRIPYRHLAQQPSINLSRLR